MNKIPESLRAAFAELPPASEHSPTSDALSRAQELGEDGVVAALSSFRSMPQSTMILANPVLYSTDVDTESGTVELAIRSYSIRGIVQEDEIVNDQISAAGLIFAGLFGRRASEAEEQAFAALLDETFYRYLDASSADDVVPEVCAFVRRFPGCGPEVAMQHFIALARAQRHSQGLHGGGIDDERDSGELLLEMIETQLRGLAIGGLSMFASHRLREEPSLQTEGLTALARSMVEACRERGDSAFGATYGFLLGRAANPTEQAILERMGKIQMHHGAAGSSMVARYFATLHAGSVLDLFAAAHLAMDAGRHFGAIHDMTAFVEKVEAMDAGDRADFIRSEILKGGLPTFGHPHIAAAGRGTRIQQDPRAAIYLGPVFDALDAGELSLSDRQRRRLAIIQQIYRIAMVEGVVKPGRESEDPLRLTPNTDFGAWTVQEALGIGGHNRTFLTYAFRGFGWMMDAREQLQQKIIRPVIAPDPRILPRVDEAQTIPTLVRRLHDRLARKAPAFGPRES